MNNFCPQCGRPSLQFSQGRKETWCRYVVDCGYAKRDDSEANRGDQSIDSPFSRSSSGPLPRWVTPKRYFGP